MLYTRISANIFIVYVCNYRVQVVDIIYYIIIMTYIYNIMCIINIIKLQTGVDPKGAKGR